MSYKLNFPLDEFKKLNSLLSEYYSEYFMLNDAGIILGSSLNEWSFNIAIIPKDMMDRLSLDSVLLHPNYIRTKISDCKKSMTYVDNNEDTFLMYQFADKIKDIPDISRGYLVLDLIHHKEGSTDPNFKHMQDIKDRVGKYTQYLASDVEFTEVPREYYMSQFISDDILTLEAGTDEHIIVTRQLFPKYQKLDSLSWAPIVIDKDYAIAIFKSEYPILTMYTFVKYLRGI